MNKYLMKLKNKMKILSIFEKILLFLFITVFITLIFAFVFLPISIFKKSYVEKKHQYQKYYQQNNNKKNNQKIFKIQKTKYDLNYLKKINDKANKIFWKGKEKVIIENKGSKTVYQLNDEKLINKFNEKMKLFIENIKMKMVFDL